MTVKQKETYSVSYDSSNDVLSEKLNILLVVEIHYLTKEI